MSDRDELDRLYALLAGASRRIDLAEGDHTDQHIQELEEASAEIDRWLATVKAEAAAEALERHAAEWATHDPELDIYAKNVVYDLADEADRIRRDAGLGGDGS